MILVYDSNGYPQGGLPLQLKDVKFEQRTIQGLNNKDLVVKKYYPILDLDNFWVKDRDYVPLNETKIQNYTIEFESLNYNMWKWTMIKSIQMNVK